MENDQLIDYSSAGFIMPLAFDDAKVYASVNAIMFTEWDGLEFSGNYFIYLLHPKKGSTTFTMEYEAELQRWVTRDAARWVENELVLQIGQGIDSQKS
jgi:hypothetical protein